MRLLLVEDDPFIALDLELTAQTEGHEVVGVAATAAEALSLAAQKNPEAALVDINLLDGPTGVDICRRLVVEFGVRAAFLTANPEQAPGDLAGALAVVEKPYTPQSLTGVLDLLADGASP